MITIFNRKEAAITYSIKRQSQIRDILATNHIDYIVDITGRALRGARNRGMVVGPYLEDVNQSTEYRIYVKKKDYEAASALIRTIKGD